MSLHRCLELDSLASRDGVGMNISPHQCSNMSMMSSARDKPLYHSLNAILLLLCTTVFFGEDGTGFSCDQTNGTDSPAFLFWLLFLPLFSHPGLFSPLQTDTPLNLTLFTNSYQARLGMTSHLWLAFCPSQGSRPLSKLLNNLTWELKYGFNHE